MDSFINWPVDTPMGDRTVNPQDLLLSSVPHVGMPTSNDPLGHSLLNPFGTPPAVQCAPVDAQGSQESSGNVLGRSQRRSATNRSLCKTTHARPSSHRESTRGSHAVSPVPSRQSRWPEDLPEQFTKAEMSKLRILLKTFNWYSMRENYHHQSINSLNEWCSMLQEELHKAQATIQSIELANCLFTRNRVLNSPSRESNQHHPYPAHEWPLARAIRVLQLFRLPLTSPLKTQSLQVRQS